MNVNEIKGDCIKKNYGKKGFNLRHCSALCFDYEKKVVQNKSLIVSDKKV